MHDRGGAERLDVAVAIGAVPGNLPVLLCGYSFGGDVSLCVDDARVVAWCAVAPPLAAVPVEEMVAPTDARPKHLLVPARDQYSSPERSASITSSWTNTTVEVIEGADHFMGGAMTRIADALLRFSEHWSR